MKRALHGLLWIVPACVVVLPNAGCPNNTNNGGPSPAAGLTAVKTAITIPCQAALRVGDEILVYGTATDVGVDYIRPLEHDTAGRGIPNGDSFNAIVFAIAGARIALVDDNQAITIYDTLTGGSTLIPDAQVKLASLATKQTDVKNLDGQLTYFVAACDDSVADGRLVKIIDASGLIPAIVPLAVNPADTAAGVTQVALDYPRVFVSTADNKFLRYDLTQPGAAPLVFDVSGGGIGKQRWAAANQIVFYYDDASYPNARMLNTGVPGSAPVTLTANPAAKLPALGGGSYCYFVNRYAFDANGNLQRSALGLAPLPFATLTGDVPLDGTNADNGLLGWGQTAAITPAGRYIFVAGSQVMGRGEYLQVSTGGNFAVIPDPDNPAALGCPATDVQCSDKLAGFKTGTDITTVCDETRIGYVLLP